jgi:hypothetical protein
LEQGKIGALGGAVGGLAGYGAGAVTGAFLGRSGAATGASMFAGGFAGDVGTQSVSVAAGLQKEVNWGQALMSGFAAAGAGFAATGGLRRNLSMQGPGGRFVASPWSGERALVRRSGRLLNPVHYPSSRLKGLLGREMARVKAFFRGERLLGREISMRVDGVEIRADLLTRTRNNRLKVIEAKLGPFSAYTDNQEFVLPRLEATGEAEFFGARASEALQPLGIDVGNGVLMKNIEVQTERFFGSRAGM